MSTEQCILLVDDSENDLLLMRKAFAQAKFEIATKEVKSGEEAIEYFKGEGHYSNRAEYPLPSLVLLDLNMPGLNGFEVLQWIREQPALKALRVLVLTTSDAIRDVNEAYRLGANSFMMKPLDFQNLVAMTVSLKDYWLTRCEAPEITRPAFEAPKR